MIKGAVLVCISLILVMAALLLDIREIGDAEYSVVIEHPDESADQTTESSAVVTEMVLPTVTPVPTISPSPSPTPPIYLTSLDGYIPGDVIADELIDSDNLYRYFTISEIQEGDAVYQRIYGQSYVDNNIIALDDLRYLKLLHVNFDGCYQVGEMIVNAEIAQQVTDIFEQLCEAKYQIYSILLIDDFWTGNGTDSDSNSIEHNNTSCFCYRPATGSSNVSRHALGMAIDLNPQQNPYVRVQEDGSRSYSHENSSDYVYNRSSDIPHVINEEDYAYQLFITYGWTWGGSWSNPIDYQHFQL